ncbi:MAG TPA: amino acid permease [Candidatus Limnocylindrales bacterium]|nr:amino acid permease [Candidatus Limnocylindrales bacterium]
MHRHCTRLALSPCFLFEFGGTDSSTPGSVTLVNQLFACKSIDKLISDSEEPEHRLKKTLGPWSLTGLGIGAVIGSGIFTVVGTAIAGQKFNTSSILNAPLADYLVHHAATLGRPGAGPALAISLVLVAIVCAFTGLCYAELASMIPIAGSAYTYTYATMGELIAWIIGWDLILEYAVSNMAVSVGFAAHMVATFSWFGWHPALRWITPAYLPGGLTDLQNNVLYAPGWHFGFNIPAFLIVLLLTVVLVRGIRESAETNNVMVILKIAAILAFVFVGMRFIHPANYHPFAPEGWPGVLTGGSIIFFTYIGFDSVSTAAEEARNPQRDLPIGIIATLIVCTVLYIAVAVVLTGIVPWQTLIDDAAPVVNSMSKLAGTTKSALLHWTELAVLFGAMMGMISSLLVFQLGQARVWFSMSRDGLLPKLFSRVHPRFRTPATATWIAGFLVGIPGGILDIGTLSDLSNIGTLFAFVLVSIGVIILRRKQPERHRGFRAPGGLAAPILSVVFCVLLMSGLPILTWLRFFVWLIIGLTVYMLYSRHRSEFSPGHRPAKR